MNFRHIRQLVVVVIGIAGGITALGASQEGSARQLEAELQAGIRLETVDGNCRGAIDHFKKVAAGRERALAAQALLRMAGCHQVLGDGQATKILALVVSDYADQPKAVAEARARQAALASPAASSEPTPARICDQCGDAYASISEDGRLMVTTSFREDLKIRALRDGTETTLKGTIGSERGGASFPLLSRDGRQVVFAWNTQGEQTTELRAVAVEPGARPKLIYRNPEMKFTYPYGWTKDGQSVLVLNARALDETWQLAWVSIADGSVRTLRSLDWRIRMPLRAASVSPDGRYVAYAALATNPPSATARLAATEQHIYVLAADGQQSEVSVVGGATINLGPVWTPDGRHVTYLSGLSGKPDLWAVPVRDGRPAGAPKLVQKNIGEVAAIGMASDGQYHYYEGRAGVVYSVIAPLGQPATAQQTTRVVGSTPSWSPDGRSVAVNRTGDVVVHTLASGIERAYKRSGIQPFLPLWFPDGKALLVVASESQQTSLYRVDLESGEFAKLAPTRGDQASVAPNVKALSPDGKTLYLGAWADSTRSRIDRIISLDLATGQYREVFAFPMAASHQPKVAQDIALAVSADGQALAVHLFSPSTEMSRLAVVGADGRNYRELIPEIRATSLRNKLTWSRDGSIHFTVSGDNDEAGEAKHRVMRIPAQGGTPEYAGVEVAGLDRFDVSFDGTRIAYASRRPIGSGRLLWKLDVAAILERMR